MALCFQMPDPKTPSQLYHGQATNFSHDGASVHGVRNFARFTYRRAKIRARIGMVITEMMAANASEYKRSFVTAKATDKEPNGTVVAFTSTITRFERLREACATMPTK